MVKIIENYSMFLLIYLISIDPPSDRPDESTSSADDQPVSISSTSLAKILHEIEATEKDALSATTGNDAGSKSVKKKNKDDPKVAKTKEMHGSDKKDRPKTVKAKTEESHGSSSRKGNPVAIKADESQVSSKKGDPKGIKPKTEDAHGSTKKEQDQSKSSKKVFKPPKEKKADNPEVQKDPKIDPMKQRNSSLVSSKNAKSEVRPQHTLPLLAKQEVSLFSIKKDSESKMDKSTIHNSSLKTSVNYIQKVKVIIKSKAKKGKPDDGKSKASTVDSKLSTSTKKSQSTIVEMVTVSKVDDSKAPLMKDQSSRDLQKKDFGSVISTNQDVKLLEKKDVKLKVQEKKATDVQKKDLKTKGTGKISSTGSKRLEMEKQNSKISERKYLNPKNSEKRNQESKVEMKTSVSKTSKKNDLKSSKAVLKSQSSVKKSSLSKSTKSKIQRSRISATRESSKSSKSKIEKSKSSKTKENVSTSSKRKIQKSKIATKEILESESKTLKKEPDYVNVSQVKEIVELKVSVKEIVKQMQQAEKSNKTNSFKFDLNEGDESPKPKVQRSQSSLLNLNKRKLTFVQNKKPERGPKMNTLVKKLNKVSSTNNMLDSKTTQNVKYKRVQDTIMVEAPHETILKETVIVKMLNAASSDKVVDDLGNTHSMTGTASSTGKVSTRASTKSLKTDPSKSTSYFGGGPKITIESLRVEPSNQLKRTDTTTLETLEKELTSEESTNFSKEQLSDDSPSADDEQPHLVQPVVDKNVHHVAKVPITKSFKKTSRKTFGTKILVKKFKKNVSSKKKLSVEKSTSTKKVSKSTSDGKNLAVKASKDLLKSTSVKKVQKSSIEAQELLSSTKVPEVATNSDATNTLIDIEVSKVTLEISTQKATSSVDAHKETSEVETTKATSDVLSSTSEVDNANASTNEVVSKAKSDSEVPKVSSNEETPKVDSSTGAAKNKKSKDEDDENSNLENCKINANTTTDSSTALVSSGSKTEQTTEQDYCVVTMTGDGKEDKDDNGTCAHNLISLRVLLLAQVVIFVTLNLHYKVHF